MVRLPDEPAMDEQRLIEKLRKIEALFARTSSHGERAAAEQAAGRVRQRLDDLRASESIEFKFTFPDAWGKELFCALLRRNGLEPYRYARQRRTTVMVRGPPRLIDEEVVPEFRELQSTLYEYLRDVTRRVIATAIHGDVSEPAIVASPREISPGSE